MARKSRPEEPIEELNLVPIMNLVVCLIPIVLLGASMVKLGVVNVNAPRFVNATGDVADPPPLDLTVALGADGLHIRARGAEALDLHPGGEEALTLAKQGDRYDWPALYNTMREVKKRYPKETLVTLTADAAVPYHELMRAMDVLRYELEGRVEDTRSLTTASVAMEEGRQALLFPDVKLAIAQ